MISQPNWYYESIYPWYLTSDFFMENYRPFENQILILFDANIRLVTDFSKQSQNIQLPLHSWYWSQPLWKNQLWSYGPRYQNMLKSKSLNFLNWIWFCYTHFYMKIQILSEKITENLGFETPLHLGQICCPIFFSF